MKPGDVVRSVGGTWAGDGSPVRGEWLVVGRDASEILLSRMPQEYLPARYDVRIPARDYYFFSSPARNLELVSECSPELTFLACVLPWVELCRQRRIGQNLKDYLYSRSDAANKVHARVKKSLR